LYNEKIAKVLKNLDHSNNKNSDKDDKEKKFECFMSKFQKSYTKELSEDYILLVHSKNYGFLFVDFSKEGIIQMDVGLNNYQQAFDLFTVNTPEIKRSLIVAGSKNGEVHFIECDTELNESKTTISKAHTA